MPTFRNTLLKKEDMPKLVKEYPAEMELLLSSLNGMFSQLHTFFDAGIQFGDNIAAQIKDIQVSEAQAYPIEIAYSIRQVPKGLIIMNAKDTTPSLPSVQTSKNNPVTTQSVSVDWTTAGEKIQIRNFGGLDPKHRYVITVLIV